MHFHLIHLLFIILSFALCSLKNSFDHFVVCVCAHVLNLFLYIRVCGNVCIIRTYTQTYTSLNCKCINKSIIAGNLLHQLTYTVESLLPFIPSILIFFFSLVYHCVFAILYFLSINVHCVCVCVCVCQKASAT